MVPSGKTMNRSWVDNSGRNVLCRNSWLGVDQGLVLSLVWLDFYGGGHVLILILFCPPSLSSTLGGTGERVQVGKRSSV